jgi:SAM-dependent methyltransferase
VNLDHSWFLTTLACPFDRTKLLLADDRFLCESNHSFRMEMGIPVFANNPRREPRPGNMSHCALDPASPVDPFVNDWIVNTNGNLYWTIRGRLPKYPIPAWPDRPPSRSGQLLVDLGCGWGRWSLAAATAGYRALGVDIHLDAVQAANRVSREIRSECDFVCSEVDRLPFRDASVDFVFSYSVLQHIERTTVQRVFLEAKRILKPGGRILVQLPNAYGALSIVQQLRRGYREAKADSFEMRYWSPRQIAELFRRVDFAPVRLRSDGFFSQNPQLSDLSLLSTFGGIVVRTSDTLARLANAMPALARLSDSLWASSRKPD